MEDTSAFQDEIRQLDMAAWGEQVAGELEKNDAVATTGEPSITFDAAARKTFPGSSGQNDDQPSALSSALEQARERLHQAVDAQRC